VHVVSAAKLAKQLTGTAVY